MFPIIYWHRCLLPSNTFSRGLLGLKWFFFIFIFYQISRLYELCLCVNDKPEEAGHFVAQHGSEYDGKFLTVGKALRASYRQCLFGKHVNNSMLPLPLGALSEMLHEGDSECFV